MRPMRWLLVACGLTVLAVRPAGTEIRLLDESDRASFRAWFVFLADAQFYRPTADVTDCAGLVRHAVREALRAHVAAEREILAGLKRELSGLNTADDEEVLRELLDRKF